jgi:hypothetical protein
MNNVLFEEMPLSMAYDKSSIEAARKKFDECKAQGIIIEGEFNDDTWRLTDDYARVWIHFQIDQISFKKYYEQIFRLNCSEFRSYLKAYTISIIGQIVLISIKEIVNDVRHIISCSPNDLMEGELFLKKGNRVLEFLMNLPEDDETSELMDNLLDCLEQLSGIQISNRTQRQLASFDSYFKFNDIINDFWKSELNNDVRLFYAPLYFWWKITAVIPLRPREFILTPKNCLTEKSDGYYLTLRRNQLKGGKNKSVFYEIGRDYKTVEYKIPNQLALELIDYKKEIVMYDSTELNTLFVTDPHYLHWNRKKHKNSRYFTYVNLNCVLRYFYNEIIQKRYGYLVIDRERKNGNYLENNEIDYIHLGDTRHIAMINILAEGGSIVTAMLLADHDNITMSAHYATNISTLIECKTYRQYKRYLGQSHDTLKLSHFDKTPQLNEKSLLLENGDRCFSPHFLHGDISDCILVLGNNGEIGDCKNCPYHRQSIPDWAKSKKIEMKQNIKADCDFLKEVVESYRKRYLEKEDILQALMRLQSSSYTYQQFCQEQLMLENEIENN